MRTFDKQGGVSQVRNLREQIQVQQNTKCAPKGGRSMEIVITALNQYPLRVTTFATCPVVAGLHECREDPVLRQPKDRSLVGWAASLGCSIVIAIGALRQSGEWLRALIDCRRKTCGPRTCEAEHLFLHLRLPAGDQGGKSKATGGESQKGKSVGNEMSHK